MSRLLLSLALATLNLYAAKPVWEEGIVVAQQRGSQTAGAVALPIGPGAVAVPITEQTNVIAIESGGSRYLLGEPNLGGPIIFRRSYRSVPLILPVNSKVSFYRDGDWFIFLDRKAKKHRFTLLGETIITPPK